MGKAKAAKSDPLAAIREGADVPPIVKAMNYGEKLNSALKEAGMPGANVEFAKLDTDGNFEALLEAAKRAKKERTGNASLNNAEYEAVHQQAIDEVGYVISFSSGGHAGCTGAAEETDFSKVTSLLDRQKIGYEILTEQDRCGGKPTQRLVSDIIDEDKLVQFIGAASAKKRVSELSPAMQSSIAAIGGDINRQVAEAEKNGAAPSTESKQRSIV